MYQKFAVTMLIAAPIIASAAAHLVPSIGRNRHASAQAEVQQSDAPTAHVMHTPPPPLPAASPPPAFNGMESAPSLEPTASIDPDAIAARQSAPVVPTPAPSPAATRQPQQEAAAGEAAQY